MRLLIDPDHLEGLDLAQRGAAVHLAERLVRYGIESVPPTPAERLVELGPWLAADPARLLSGDVQRAAVLIADDQQQEARRG